MPPGIKLGTEHPQHPTPLKFQAAIRLVVILYPGATNTQDRYHPFSRVLGWEVDHRFSQKDHALDKLARGLSLPRSVPLRSDIRGFLTGLITSDFPRSGS